MVESPEMFESGTLFSIIKYPKLKLHLHLECSTVTYNNLYRGHNYCILLSYTVLYKCFYYCVYLCMSFQMMNIVTVSALCLTSVSGCVYVADSP